MPGKILAKVIEYCKYHVEANKKVDDKPAKSEDDVKQWDNEFVKVDQATLFDLILVGAAAELWPPIPLGPLTRRPLLTPRAPPRRPPTTSTSRGCWTSLARPSPT